MAHPDMTRPPSGPLDVDHLVRDEQVRQHRQTLPAAVAGSALLGVIVALVQSQVTGLAPAAIWLLVLAACLLAHLAVYRWHARADVEVQRAHAWIGRYRMIALVHGVVWALSSYWLFPPLDLAHQLFLVFTLAGLCVSTLAGNAFDLRAALLFCLPVLGALMVRLLTLGTGTSTMMLSIGLLFIVVVLVIALRAHRTMRETVALRGAQATQLADVRRGHAQLQRAEQFAGLGSYAWDPRTKVLEWSEGHFRLWGLEPGSVAPSLALFRSGVHPQDLTRVNEAFRRTQDQGEDLDCRFRVCWPDGSVHHVLGRSEVRRDGHGQAIAILGTVQDVTLKNETEVRLLEKQRLLSVMQQTTQLGFWFVDANGSTTDVNPALCTMLARPREDILGSSILTLVEPSYARRLQEQLAHSDMSGNAGKVVDLLQPDGSRVRCLAHETTLTDGDGAVVGIVVMLSDLSAVERARAAQHVSEFVVNSISDMVSVTDFDGKYRFVNDAWCHRNGLTREQVMGRHFGAVVPHVATPERLDALAQCASRNEMRVVRAEIVFENQDRRVMETTMTPYLTRASKVQGVVAVTRDVTEQVATRDALAQSLENLRRTFNATTDGMFAYDASDPEGRLLFANDRFFEMWHMTVDPSQVTTREDVHLAARQLYIDPEQEMARVAAILAMDEPHTDRVELRDGRVLERRSVPMKNGSGPTRVWTFRDITLQEQAIEALRANDGQQRALMDAFPGYVSVIDQDLVYTYVKERKARLFGLTPAAIVGKSVRDLLGEEPHQQIAAEIGRINAGERVVVERRYEATAQRAAVDLQVTEVMGVRGTGGLQRYYAFGVDITELKRAEEALRSAKDDAERADRAKSAFLASVSHELRTPLNAIIGFSQLLRADAQVTQSASENVGEIERAGRHLLSLVDDLIDLGGVEAGHLELTMVRVAVETIINESLSMVAPLAANQGIRIVFEGGDARNAVVLADAVRLRQIVINLLSNAIKYNRPDGSVRVSCQRQRPVGHDGPAWIRIAVTDTGNGISPDMASRVFSAFERLGSERGSVEGTGIGLAISRRLVSAMGGSIGYKSRVHEGSMFWIDLPPLPQTSAPGTVSVDPQPARAVQPLRQRGRSRLLVAEDYGPNQTVLKLQLGSLGCNVDMVADGVEALVKWRANRYDLVLSDLDMPRMGGHDLARAIRAQESARGARVPIVAISAAVVPGELARCMAAGMDDMLTKPISLEGLAAMLERWLGEDMTQHAIAAPAAETPALASGLPVLDIESLYRVLGRVSTAHAQTLLSTFVDAAQEGIDRLAEPVQDAAVLVREMHRQRSSALTVGALRYAQLAHDLERRALDNDMPDLAQVVQELRAALQQVRDHAHGLEVVEPTSLPAPLQDELPPDALVGSVMVVDDDPVILLQMQEMLAGIGIKEVLTARNGVEAILQMGRRESPPDVVVCDLNMPEMDGVEMIRRFGQSGFRGGLILMSGADEQLLTTVGNLAQLQGLIVLGQVHKPATPRQMITLLQPAVHDHAIVKPASGGVVLMTPQAILAGIRDAEFSIWFQPKVKADTLKPVGVEALARWRQPDGSDVSPDLFIIASERAGIIGQLSAVLLDTALREGAKLHRAGFPLTIALNLSAQWLDDLNLPDLLLQAVLSQGLKPADINLEVTETGVTKDIAIALDVLTRLRLKGFGLSIDDFGIGYSSFEQLGRIPFTEMKLDRSFVARGTRDAAARAILESSMAMATKLELRTVAEGVETLAELALVRELGCDDVQGFLIARPMPCEALIQWLQERTG
jgi:PAS domain S-box-containing protein